MSSGISNIWEAAAQEVAYNEKNNQTSFDKYILLMGGKSSGKTTALLKFLARDDNAKPTTALEYTFARRTTNLQQKLTSHIWELGGGTNLNRLLDVALNLQSMDQMTVVLMLDLSQPAKLWVTAETLLNAARNRFDAVIKLAGKHTPSLPNDVMKRAWDRIGGKDRKDSRSINPFPVSLVIIGTKFDLFQELESDKKQVITKCIRHLAHANGATALYLSSKIEATIRGWKHVMNVASFDNKLNMTPVIDSSKPLYIPCGVDSADAIGTPPLAPSDVGRASTKNPNEAWKVAFCGHFPQESEAKLKAKDDPAKDPQFKEPKIDELRAQKDRELEAFKKQENQKWTSKIQ